MKNDDRERGSERADGRDGERTLISPHRPETLHHCVVLCRSEKSGHGGCDVQQRMIDQVEVPVVLRRQSQGSVPTAQCPQCPASTAAASRLHSPANQHAVSTLATFWLIAYSERHQK